VGDLFGFLFLFLIEKKTRFKSGPRNHERHCRNAVAFACLLKVQFSVSPLTNTSDPDSVFDK
jgi:hypothetical protein